MPKVKTKFGQENKLIHPKSRKAEQISREWHRDVRVKHKRKETAIKMSALGEKVAWFRDHLEETAASTAYSPKMIADLIEDYLNRFDEELEQIHIKNQVGKRTSRQHASREDTIQHMKKLEMEEYEGCGFEIPDLSCPKNLEYLRLWDGELRFIQNINLRRFRKKELMAPPVDDEAKHAESETACGGSMEVVSE